MNIQILGHKGENQLSWEKVLWESFKWKPNIYFFMK